MSALYRAVWVAQHLTGVFNAFFMLVGLDNGNWWSAGICGVCMLFTASWRVCPVSGSGKR